MSLFGEEVVPRLRHILTCAVTVDRTTAEPSSSIQRAASVFATGVVPGRLASYRINGETGALTPLAGQCPRGFWQLITAERGSHGNRGSDFFTDYSMAPTDLAVALKQRGFNSLWVAEHWHIPVTGRFTHPLGEAALTKEYFGVMDPFVTLSAAAAVTKRLKLGTAICLVIPARHRQTVQLLYQPVIERGGIPPLLSLRI